MTMDSHTGGYEVHECTAILQKSKNVNSLKRPHALAYRYTACKQKSILNLHYEDRRKFLSLSIKI